jgi:hypothetical protein
MDRHKRTILDLPLFFILQSHTAFLFLFATSFEFSRRMGNSGPRLTGAGPQIADNLGSGRSQGPVLATFGAEMVLSDSFNS